MSETEGRPIHELDATEEGVGGIRYRVGRDNAEMIVYEPIDEGLEEGTGGVVMTKFTHTVTTTFEGEGPLPDIQRYLAPGRADQPAQPPYQAYGQVSQPSYPDYSHPLRTGVAVQEPVTRPYETVPATEPFVIAQSPYNAGPRRNALWYTIKQQTAERKRFRKIGIPVMIGTAVVTAALLTAPTVNAKSSGYTAGTECTSGGWASIFNLGSCYAEGFIRNYLPSSSKTTGEKK